MIIKTLKLALLSFALFGLAACDSGSSNTGGEQAPPLPLVGPDLNGDNWVGFFKNLHGAFTPLTARVIHIGDGIIIQTSLPATGVGRRLEGNIRSKGSMLLYDRFDGEDWTTLFGAANTNSIKVADFVFIGGVNTDTNSIELFR